MITRWPTDPAPRNSRAGRRPRGPGSLGSWFGRRLPDRWSRSRQVREARPRQRTGPWSGSTDKQQRPVLRWRRGSADVARATAACHGLRKCSLRLLLRSWFQCARSNAFRINSELRPFWMQNRHSALNGPAGSAEINRVRQGRRGGAYRGYWTVTSNVPAYAPSTRHGGRVRRRPEGEASPPGPAARLDRAAERETVGDCPGTADPGEFLRSRRDNDTGRRYIRQFETHRFINGYFKITWWVKVKCSVYHLRFHGAAAPLSSRHGHRRPPFARNPQRPMSPRVPAKRALDDSFGRAAGTTPACWPGTALTSRRYQHPLLLLNVKRAARLGRLGLRHHESTPATPNSSIGIVRPRDPVRPLLLRHGKRWRSRFTLLCLYRAEDRRLLAAMFLSEKANAYSRTFRRGMKRRLLVAKAMVHSPPILAGARRTGPPGSTSNFASNSGPMRGSKCAGRRDRRADHPLSRGAEELCDRIAIINYG